MCICFVFLGAKHDAANGSESRNDAADDDVQPHDCANASKQPSGSFG